MEILMIQVKEFLKKYELEMAEVLLGYDFWRKLCICLYEENVFNQDDLIIVEKILNEKYSRELFEKETLTLEEKAENIIYILENFWNLNHVFRERENVNERSDIPGIEYREFIKENSVNEDKYIQQFYEIIYKYFIIAQMYKGKYHALFELIEKNVCYKKYGNRNVLTGGYFCLSPIGDLIVDNAKRGCLLKRVPKDLSNKIEYCYDKKGQLLMSKWYIESCKLYECEFFLHAEEYVLCIVYSVEEEKINKLILCKYEEEKILELENVYWPVYNEDIYKGYFGEIGKEIYRYSKNGRLSSSMVENYIFPKLKKNDSILGIRESGEMLQRDEYDFIYDEQTIKGFVRKNYLGERYWESRSGYIQISKNKAKTTKKDSIRWKKINYFNEL